MRLWVRTNPTAFFSPRFSRAGLARNDGGLTALMMVKEKFYVDVINLLYEAEQKAGVSEGSCSTKHAPGSSVITFRKPLARS